MALCPPCSRSVSYTHLFIPKPFDPEQLFATVLRWLPASENRIVPADAVEIAPYQPLSDEALAQAVQSLAGALASGDLESSRLFAGLETHLMHRYGSTLALSLIHIYCRTIGRTVGDQ